MLWKKCLFSGERNNTGLFFRCFVQSFGCLSAVPFFDRKNYFRFSWSRLTEIDLQIVGFFVQIIIENVGLFWWKMRRLRCSVWKRLHSNLEKNANSVTSFPIIKFWFSLKLSTFFSSSGQCLFNVPKYIKFIVVFVIKTGKTSQPLYEIYI